MYPECWEKGPRGWSPYSLRECHESAGDKLRSRCRGSAHRPHSAEMKPTQVCQLLKHNLRPANFYRDLTICCTCTELQRGDTDGTEEPRPALASDRNPTRSHRPPSPL